MAFMVVKCYGDDEDEYMRFVQKKNDSAWTTYTDITRSFVRVRVEKRGGHWFFEFIPSLPPFHLYMFGITALLWVIGVKLQYLMIPLVIGGLIGLWWTPLPYMFFMIVGFRIKQKRFPQIWFVGSRDAVREMLRW